MTGVVGVSSQSARTSAVGGRKYWPRTAGEFGRNPHMSWSNLPDGCELVTVKIIDLGGEGEYADEGAGFVHLHLNLPAREFSQIKAGGADALAKRYGLPNSAGEVGFYPFRPRHGPHHYAVDVSACDSHAQLVYSFPPPPPPPRSLRD